MCPVIKVVIPTYSLLAFVGFSVVVLMLFAKIDSYNISFKHYLQLILYAAAGCFLGSKLLFAITQIPGLIQNFSAQNLLLLLPNSGFVFYGGLFGTLLAVHLFIKRKKVYDAHTVYNMVTPAFPLFHSFGRIGCFMAGCCYGKWLQHPVKVFGMLELKRYPVQIFEAGYEFILFLILNRIQKKNPDTNLLQIYLMCYAVFRFCIEFLRGDAIRGIVFGLSVSQWISLMILVFYIGKWIIKKHDSVLR